jgi:hypothetical protein
VAYAAGDMQHNHQKNMDDHDREHVGSVDYSFIIPIYIFFVFSCLFSFHSLADFLIKESPHATGSGVMPPSQDPTYISSKHECRR